jgi:hypothetical protein
VRTGEGDRLPRSPLRRTIDPGLRHRRHALRMGLPRRGAGRAGPGAMLDEKGPLSPRRALGRAFPMKVEGGRIAPMTPEDVREMARYVASHRAGSSPFELVVAGERRAKTRRLAPPSWRPTWRPALPGGWRASTPGISGGRRASPGRPKRCAVECGKDRRRHETRTGISGHCCRDRLRVGRRRSRQRRCRFASEWAPRG